MKSIFVLIWLICMGFVTPLLADVTCSSKDGSVSCSCKSRCVSSDTSCWCENANKLKGEDAKELVQFLNAKLADTKFSDYRISGIGLEKKNYDKKLFGCHTKCEIIPDGLHCEITC